MIHFVHCNRVQLTFVGNMMRAFKGAGPRIQRQYPRAIPLWCTTHQLNRAIVQSSTELAIRNMIGTVDTVSSTPKI